MSSVAAASSGLSSWLQSLSTADPALASALQSPTVQSALQNSPRDVVQLSDQALQLQEVQSLFGNPVTAGPLSVLTPSEAQMSSSSLLQSIDTSLFGSTGTDSSTGGNTPADLSSQISSYEAALQAQQMQSLFAPYTPDGSTTNSINLLA